MLDGDHINIQRMREENIDGEEQEGPAKKKPAKAKAKAKPSSEESGQEARDEKGCQEACQEGRQEIGQEDRCQETTKKPAAAAPRRLRRSL